MSNVKRLAGDTSEKFNIAAAEADHEPVKVTITLPPLTQFIIEGSLSRHNRTSAVRQLLDLAALDLLEAKGYELNSDNFRELYHEWLTRKPYNDVDPETGEETTFYPAVHL